MKKLLIMTMLLSGTAFSQTTPLINSGEVKINYPCEVLDKLPKEKEEKESITFYDLDNNPVYVAGYILRKRVNTDSKEADFTIKYRTRSPSIILDQTLYKKLSGSPSGKLKCEFDVPYNHVELMPTYSCSFKSDTENPLDEHLQFVRMVKVPLPHFTRDIENFREFNAQGQSWNLKLTPEQQKKSPFKKKISLEKWTVRNECRLEVSGRIETVKGDSKVIHRAAGEAFAFLMGVIPGSPAPKQGSKTKWVLGL
ncbi:MAG: hypothetical protein ACLGHN_01510 [Bacteriovoracia bacterium]